MGEKPKAVFKVGAVRASIFQNTVTRNGQEFPLPKVILEVRYKDKTGEWRGTNSLSLNEVPKAVLALNQAYEYLTAPKDSGDESDSGKTSNTNDTNFYGAPLVRPGKDLKSAGTFPMKRR